MKFGKHTLDLECPRVMGVLNVTPDSFSDGGLYKTLDTAVARAELMMAQGAAIIDVGGESTRPGAAKVSVQEEMDRVCPVVERLVTELDALVSVDTSTPEVMREVVALGCSMLNDVRAFQREGVMDVVKDIEVPLCVMHMQGEPDTMQLKPAYEGVVAEVSAFLKARCDRLIEAGVESERLIVDPGFGFGKTLAHNLAMLKGLTEFGRLGYPVLVGMSRKSMIGEILGKEVDQRMAGSVSAAVIAAMNGSAIIRVHDVAETVDALKVVQAVQ